VSCGRPHAARRALRAAIVVACGLVATACAGAAVAPSGLFLSPTGSDASNCTRAAPCASLQRAYLLAKPGQVVQLAGGVYPAQGLSAAPKSSSTHVVFEPAPGAAVSFAGRLALDGATHVTLSGFTLARTGPTDRSLFIASCTSDITLDGLTGETFFIEEGTSQITFDGGSWGGYGTPGEQDSAVGTSGAAGPANSCGGQLAPPAHAILFDGVTFHDVFWGVPAASWGGSHPDCFEVNGYVDGLTVRNSHFMRCASTFMEINPDQGDIANLTIENNTYTDLGPDSWYGITISSGGIAGHCGNLVFRHNIYLPDNAGANTWPNGPVRTDCQPPPGASPVLITDNVFARSPPANECARYLAAPYVASWTDNLYADGTCGSTAGRVPFGYTLGPSGLLAASPGAGAVQKLFAVAAKGTTAGLVARALARAHTPAPPGRRWTAALVRTLLSDPVYAGGVYGAPGANPALVPRASWRAAQKVIAP